MHCHQTQASFQLSIVPLIAFDRTFPERCAIAKYLADTL